MNTPIRSMRLGDDLWEWLDAKAKEEGTSRAEIMRKVLIEEINKEGK